MAARQAPQVPPAERVHASYKQLSDAAANLNIASDNLAKAIALWDEALVRLNLGVSAWVQVSGNDDGSGSWWSRDLGYSKVKEKWGLSLRTSNGHHGDSDRDSETVWIFNEAPRWFRVDSLSKLPDLLDALLREAENTTSRIKSKTTLAYELASACYGNKEDTPVAMPKGDAGSTGSLDLGKTSGVALDSIRDAVKGAQAALTAASGGITSFEHMVDVRDLTKVQPRGGLDGFELMRDAGRRLEAAAVPHIIAGLAGRKSMPDAAERTAMLKNTVGGMDALKTKGQK